MRMYATEFLVNAKDSHPDDKITKDMEHVKTILPEINKLIEPLLPESRVMLFCLLGLDAALDPKWELGHLDKMAKIIGFTTDFCDDLHKSVCQAGMIGHLRKHPMFELIKGLMDDDTMGVRSH